MNRLRKMGAHKIIQVYFVWLMLGTVFVMKFGIEWLGLWVFVLLVSSAALLLLVVFADVGSTWNDKD